MSLPERRPTKMVLYQYDACFESARVRRLLRQMDLGFTAETLAPGDKSVIKFKFHKSSVPVLQDGPFVSDDLPEILAHIEKSYGTKSKAAPVQA